MISSILPSKFKYSYYKKSAIKVSSTADKYIDHGIKKCICDLNKYKSEKVSGFDLVLPPLVALIFFRTGKRAYLEQIASAISMFKDNFTIEMKTGEGKTIVGFMVSALYAISGRSVHFVTANSYLAQRDATEASHIFEDLDFSVSFLDESMNGKERRLSYCSEILWSSPSELVFDHLRSKSALTVYDRIENHFDVVIIDELDSVLLDNARTPYVISDESTGLSINTSNYAFCFMVAQKLVKQREKFLVVNLKERNVGINKAGYEILKAWFEGADSDVELGSMSVFTYRVKQALEVLLLIKRDVDYLVKDREIILISNETGRILNSVKWSHGLHQFVEMKEGLEISSCASTRTSITSRLFFNKYRILVGLSGTLLTDKYELADSYGIDILPIPTHTPSKRIDHPDKFFLNKDYQFAAIINFIASQQNPRPPILICTQSVDDSSVLSELLNKNGYSHNMLDAKHPEHEAEVISCAGLPNTITISTNLAGRGTDIKLGVEGENDVEGNPNSHKFVNEVLGGLQIIGVGRNSSRRVDNQLIGRSGRQGDCGSSRFFCSLDDPLMAAYGSFPGVKSLLENAGEDGLVMGSIQRSIYQAQQLNEGADYTSRKSSVRFVNVINAQESVVETLRENVIVSYDVIETIKSLLSLLFARSEGLPLKLIVQELGPSVVKPILYRDSSAVIARVEKDLSVDGLTGRDLLQVMAEGVKTIDDIWVEYESELEYLKVRASYNASSDGDVFNIFATLAEKEFEALISKMALKTIKAMCDKLTVVSALCSIK
ncbi:preprotein translocase subunit SecA [Photobacterium leiognathi]|uniref:preprotein translocase subunit SecA n=1 Tax=Photobacterium leiognathi TaxID=553611 RepID=UPI0029827F69|nr:DEAD/DEAH box helicase [Photobacterium leiognathi]